MTQFYLVQCIMSLLVLENIARQLDSRYEESAALQEESRQAPFGQPRAYKIGALRQFKGDWNLHRKQVSKTIISYCESGGVCISSGACPWNRLMADDIDCMLKRNDYVCCKVAKKKRFSLDVFHEYN